MKFNHITMIALAAVSLGVIGARASTQADALIDASIKKSFVYRHLLKGDDVRVHTEGGVVTLTGSVSRDYRKTLAKEAAAAQTGVTSVDDRLEVKPSGPKTGSDAWLAGKVKASLLFHRSVSATGTKIGVKDGVVTLSGRTDSQAQKDLTAEYAQDVDGVKSVRNQLTVAKAPAKAQHLEEEIDDASVTSEAKLALLVHRSTSALDTTVRTDGGVVTLSGKAKSTAEKDLAGKIVADLKGVKDVKNEISVE